MLDKYHESIITIVNKLGDRYDPMGKPAALFRTSLGGVIGMSTTWSAAAVEESRRGLLIRRVVHV